MDAETATGEAPEVSETVPTDNSNTEGGENGSGDGNENGENNGENTEGGNTENPEGTETETPAGTGTEGNTTPEGGNGEEAADGATSVTTFGAAVLAAITALAF